MTLSPTLLIFLAYLLGSLPFGLIFTRLFGEGDIRKIGSGNIGATNVLRTGKKKLAVMTLLLDMFKGICAVWLALATIPELAPVAGLAALLGHMFPLWLSFKGGKGVSTFLGVTAALYWPLALMVSLVWLSTASLMRISSLAALCAVLSTLVFIDSFQVHELLPSFVIMIVFVIAKHYTNIFRLIIGTEPEIGQTET